MHLKLNTESEESPYIVICLVAHAGVDESIVDSEQDLMGETDDGAVSDYGIADLLPSSDDASNDSVTEVTEVPQGDNVLLDDDVHAPETGSNDEDEDDENDDVDTVSITSCTAVLPGVYFNTFLV